MAGVDQSVQERFGDDGVREQWVPIFRGPVAREDQGFAGDGSIGDEVIEVIGLGGGVLTHREVVDDEHVRPGVFTHALPDGAVGMPAGEVGEHAGTFDESDVASASGYLMTECLCDMGFPDTDRAVEDDRLARVEPPKSSEIAEHRCGQFRADGEVEVLEGVGLLELRSAHSSGQGGGFSAGDFVFTEHLQEFEVSELTVACLSEPGVECVQHSGEFEGFQCGSQGWVVDGHHCVLRVE